MRIKKCVDIIYDNDIDRDITIMHISDIHFSINTKERDLNKLKEEIIRNNPDYLMITGDLIDVPSITKNKYKIRELVLFLTDLSKYFKIFISIGNHDIVSKHDMLFFRKINELNNIYVLDDMSYQDEYIYISGLTLPHAYYYNSLREESELVLLEHIDNNSKIINRLPKKLFKVLLIHSPIKLTEDKVIKKLSEYDLILSGHTHNGMVPCIFDKIFSGNMGIISPEKRLFPKIARGKIDRYINNKKITIIINGAITKLSNKSGVIFSKLNFIYSSSINKIVITKKRGIYYE